MGNRLVLDANDKTIIHSFISNSNDDFPAQAGNVYVEISEEDYREVLKNPEKSFESDAAGKVMKVDKPSAGLWQSAEEKQG
jgi:hypothetical protein